MNGDLEKDRNSSRADGGRHSTWGGWADRQYIQSPVGVK